MEIVCLEAFVFAQKWLKFVFIIGEADYEPCKEIIGNLIIHLLLDCLMDVVQENFSL
jgi:hypothetical protein